jgi:hypothetical protein
MVTKTMNRRKSSGKNFLTRKIVLLPEGDRIQMRRIVKPLLIFLLLQVLVFILLLALRTCRDSQNYWGASIDKHERLESAPGPRLILVGGSGVALGTDSRVLEEMTGYNPVNMSLAAGLGPEFMLSEVAEDIRAGDVVVVILSYEALLQNTTNRCVLGLLHSNPAGFRYVSDPWKIVVLYLSDILSELRGAPRAAWEMLTEALALRTPTRGELRWRRTSFNEYGDVIYERVHNPELVEAYHRFPERSTGYPDAVISLLNEFQDICRSRDATAVWSYAAIPDSTYLLNREVIDTLHRQLLEELMLDIINDPDEMILPFALFSDTHYHLTQSGATESSGILARGFLRWRAGAEIPDR